MIIFLCCCFCCCSRLFSVYHWNLWAPNLRDPQRRVQWMTLLGYVWPILPSEPSHWLLMFTLWPKPWLFTDCWPPPGLCCWDLWPEFPSFHELNFPGQFDHASINWLPAWPLLQSSKQFATLCFYVNKNIYWQRLVNNPNFSVPHLTGFNNSEQYCGFRSLFFLNFTVWGTFLSCTRLVINFLFHLFAQEVCICVCCWWRPIYTNKVILSTINSFSTTCFIILASPT